MLVIIVIQITMRVIMLWFIKWIKECEAVVFSLITHMVPNSEQEHFIENVFIQDIQAMGLLTHQP